MKRAWVLGLLSVAGCATPSVSFEVDVPADVVGSVGWIEIGAFAGGCPAKEQLAGGLPRSGVAARVAFPPDKPRAMGALAAGTWGFAAVVRGADCRVLATACTAVDVSRARDVHLRASSVSSDPATACGAGSVCQDARCVPPRGAEDPSFGADCSLELVGAGPLANPLGASDVQASAPAISARGDGFLIAYTEVLATDGTTRLTLLSLDGSGGLVSEPLSQMLDGHCAGTFGADATAASTTASGSGLIVSPRPACNGGATRAGLELLLSNAEGTSVSRSSVTLSQTADGRVDTSTRAVAQVGNAWVVAARVDGAAALVTTDGKAITGSKVFGDPADRAVRIARSTGVQIVAAEGPSRLGASGTVARVNVSSATGSPLTIPTPPDDEVEMTLSSVAATGSRAVLLSDGPGDGDDVLARVYDVNNKSAPASASLALPIGSGALVALDAAARGDRLFVVAGRSRALSLVAVPGATTTLDVFKSRRAALSTDLRIPNTYVDGPVSVATTGSRVAVVWASRKGAMSVNDVVGGYAVFACR